MLDARQPSDVASLVNPDEAIGAITLRKISWRLLPLIGIGYCVAILDRGTISFASLQMNLDLHFTATIYGFGAGLFSIGNALFEIPSNLALFRLGRGNGLHA